MKLRKSVIVSLSVVFAILFFFAFGYVSFITYINWPNGRTIAKNLKVTQEWSEVNIDPPLTPAQRVQEINLRIDNFKDDPTARDFKIKLSDGTIIEPEVELYDENGTKFVMHHSGFVTKWYDDIVFSPGHSNQFTDLPANRTFTKLRIRSDVPFTCDQIYWRDYNPK